MSLMAVSTDATSATLPLDVAVQWEQTSVGSGRATPDRSGPSVIPVSIGVQRGLWLTSSWQTAHCLRSSAEK